LGKRLGKLRKTLGELEKFIENWVKAGKTEKNNDDERLVSPLFSLCKEQWGGDSMVPSMEQV
jgi:hypothetical protein